MRWTPRHRLNSVARRRIAWLLGVALLLPYLTAIAWAGGDGVSRIAVVVMPDDDRQAGAARQLRRSFLSLYRDSPTVNLVNPFSPRVPAELGDRAEKLLARGKRKVEHGHYRAALKDLDSALDEMIEDPGARLKAVLADAMLHVAMARLGAGQRRGALDQLEALIVWRPQVRTELPYAPEGWQDLVDRAREWRESAAVGSALVTSIPRQAEVFIDGRALGPTPVVASNLVVGTHYLTLQADGHLRIVVPLKVVAGVQVTTSVKLQPDPRWSEALPLLEEAREALGEKRLPSCAALRNLLDAEQALFVTVGGGARLTFAAYLYDLDDNRRLGQTKVTSSGPLHAEQMRLLALWEPSSVVSTAVVQVHESDGRPRRGRPWYKSWWVLGAATVGVAAAVGVPLALRSSSSSGHEEVFEVQW